MLRMCMCHPLAIQTRHALTCRVDGVPMLSHQRVLFYGAGQANLGAARLLVRAMQDGGMSYDEAKRRIWLMDSKGLIHEGRTGLNSQKAEFAHPLDALPQDAPSNTSVSAFVPGLPSLPSA